MSTAIINGESRALAIPTPSASGRKQLNFTIHIQIEQRIAVVLRSAPCRRYTLLRFGKPGEIN
jgi:hypothetical protein